MMKSKNISIISVLLIMTGTFVFSPVHSSIFDKIKDTADKATKKIKKGAKKGEKEIKKGVKETKKGIEKGVKEAKKGIEKGVKEIEKFSKDVIKELSKLGLPTEPDKLIEFLFTNLPISAWKKMLGEIWKIAEPQLSDLVKIVDMTDRLFTDNDLVRAIPPLPPLGFFLSWIPSIGSFAEALVNSMCDLTIAKEVTISKRRWLAFLVAFHSVTNNKYINKEESAFIKSYYDFRTKKGVIDKAVNLGKIQDIESVVNEKINQILKPLTSLIDYIQKSAMVLLRPFVQIGGMFRPVPFAAFIPSVPAGPINIPIARIYNRMIYVFHFIDIKNALNDIESLLVNNYQIKQKTLIPATIQELESTFMKPVLDILKTYKASIPGEKLMEKMDQLFVDPLSKIPWGTHSLITVGATVLNLAGNVVDKAIKSIIETVVMALTAGVGGFLVKPIAGIINTDSICEFISETMYWSYIRFFEQKLDRMNQLIKKAQQDGVVIDGNALKKEVEAIMSADSKKEKELDAEFGSKSGSTKGKDKKSDEASGKKDKKDKKDKKNKNKDGSDKKSGKKKKKDKNKDDVSSIGGVIGVAYSADTVQDSRPKASVETKQTLPADPDDDDFNIHMNDLTAILDSLDVD